MGGGPSVAVFFTLLIAAITTFLYLDRQDQVKYDTLAKNAQRALVEKVVSDLRSPASTGPSPSNLQKVVGPSPSNPQEDTKPSPATNTMTSAIETLCDKYPWNDLCRDRPGWTGIKPSDSDPPTPDIPETTPYMAMDVDGNSAVNFPEFFNATSPQIGGAISEDDLFQSFNIIDKNSDGFISEAEFAGTIGPSPIPTDTQPPTNIGPSPDTLSSATRSFCEEYPWNSLCKDRPGWTGIKPIYPSVENIEPSPVIIESSSVTPDPLPDISTTSMDMLCEQYPWNDLCKDRPGWTGIEPIYKAQDAIGPSPMFTGPSPNIVTSSMDTLCEKYPWNDLCRDRPSWTGVVPDEEFDTGDITTTSETSSEKGYEALSSGRYADALIEYTNALSIASDSEKPLLYNNRSIAYMRMGQFDSALRDANNIDATIDTNKLLRYTRTADALYGLERYTEAKNSYQLAVDMNPSSDNLILGLQRAERAEKLTTTLEEDGTYTFTLDSTQGAYNSALAFTETSGTTQVTENSTERAEQSAVDVLCATTFWHEMCKDRPGWTGTPPDENIPTVDNTVLDTICEQDTGTAPWLEICSYQEGWTGERPVETSSSTQTGVISYTDYSSGLADISQSGGTGVIQGTEQQSNDTGVIQGTEEQSNDTEDQISLSKWKYVYDRDVVGGGVFDTFALSPNSETKANMETCLMKCNEQDYCKGVAFNDTFDRCWGKSSVSDTEKNPDRILYTKTDAMDGILKPWNQELPTPPTLKWRYVPDTDVDKIKTPWEDHTFHYTQETDIKASPETCITECAGQTDCEGVVFNKENTLCWGMREATVQHTKYSAARNLYRKTYESDGILKPWTQMSITSTVDAETETPDAEPTKWTFEDGVDVTGNQTFHFVQANFENCIKECDSQSYCKAVVFNDDKTKCWGKLNAVGRLNAANRSLYTKTDDVNGISEPWNFCSNDENMLHPMCKTQLDEKCETNITDPLCKGYTAYDTEQRTQLDVKCATNIIDEECAGYQAYDNAIEQRELDEYCALETEDSKCEDYPVYKAAREAEKLDAKCTENPTHSDCADRPGYEEAIAESIAKQNTFWKYRLGIDIRGGDTFHYHKNTDPKANLEVCLRKCNDQGDDCAGVVFDKNEELCWGKSSAVNAALVGSHRKFYEKTSDPNDIKQPWNFCSKKINLSDPYCEPQLKAYCENEDEDDICEGYDAYEAKKQLDEKCATDTTDEECADYPAYKAKKQLDARCETNTIDEECAGYPVYKAKRQLDTKCATNTMDEECEGYDAYDNKQQLDAYCENEDGNDICEGYDAYEAKRQLDTKCATNTMDEECADYPAYKAKKQLDARCETNTTDGDCVGYPVYDAAEAKRQLDTECATNTTDEECADYPAYKAKKQLDEKCATNTTDGDCVGYPVYDAAEAKRQLDAKCASDLAHIDCASYPGYTKAKLIANTFWKYRPGIDVSGWGKERPVIDLFHYHKGTNPKANLEVCLNKCTDYDNCGGVVFDEHEELCWGRLDDDVRDTAFKSNWPKKRNLYEKTSNPNDINKPWIPTEEQIEAIAVAEEAKRQLDEKCKTDTTDPKCAGYDAYEEAKRQLDEKCATNTIDEDCAGYDEYDKAEAKRQLDTKCETNTTDGDCVGYDAYDTAQAKRQLDTKCATNTIDPECADYVAYKAEMLCGSDDSIRDPLCFIKMCLKKDAPSICEENPDRIRIRSVAKEVDDEILEELCKDSKDSNGNFKWYAPSICRSTGSKCGAAARGGKCHGDACCSYHKWCGGTTGGQRTAHCAYSDGEGGYRGRDGGKFDGDASRQEEDRIARRPANFLDMVYQRVGDTSLCDIPANVLDPECGDYDLAMSIADEVDDEILTELCKDSKWVNGGFKHDAPSACRTTATEWNPDDYKNMNYRCGFGEYYGDEYWDGNQWTRKLKKFGNTKCPRDHCCSNANWCGAWGKSGQKNRDGWCFAPDGKGGYRGQQDGKYDGDASRQTEDKIARRPADFLDTVYQRVQERKAS